MFRERLKSLRKEANLTQKELARKLNISQPQYARTESGGRNPSTKTIEKFALFFNVSTDYLLGNTDIKNPTENLLKDAEVLFQNTVSELNLTKIQEERFKEDITKFIAQKRQDFEEDQRSHL